MFDELAKVKAPFNPLAAMKDHPDEVEKISYSKDSLVREKCTPQRTATQLDRLKKDAQRVRQQDAEELRTKLAELSKRNLNKDLAGLLAQAALHFLPKP